MASLFLAPVSMVEAIDGLARILSTTPFTSLAVRVTIDSPLGRSVVNYDGQGDGFARHNQVVAAREEYSSHHDWRPQSFKLARRDTTSVSIDYSRGDGITAQLSIGQPDGWNVPDVKMMEALTGAFRITERSEILKDALPNWVTSAMRQNEVHAQDLLARTREMETFLGQLAIRQQKHVEDTLTRLNAAFAEKEAALNGQLAAERAKLREIEADLDARKSAFETRESKYVRRDLLRRIEARLTDRQTVQVSEQTAQKRRVVERACYVTFAVCGSVIAAILYSLLIVGSTFDTAHAIPLTSMTLIMASTLVYFLRWQDDWFRRHAEAEFRSVSTATDILRASWLAELVFEWNSEKEETLPPILLENFSRNLFNEGTNWPVEHPAEAMSKMLKDATSLRVGKGIFELSRPDTRPQGTVSGQ